MNRDKLRMHAVAIGIISLVIIAIFLIMRPKHYEPVDPTLVMGDRYIQVYNATWGENCNRYIDELIANPLPLQRDKKGRIVETKRLSRVSANNVLDVLNATCTGKLSCSITANAAELGIDPLQSCYKELAVSYRCYTMDRLWPTLTRQGETLAIDCNEKTAEPPVTDETEPDFQNQPQQ